MNTLPLLELGLTQEECSLIDIPYLPETASGLEYIPFVKSGTRIPLSMWSTVDTNFPVTLRGIRSINGKKCFLALDKDSLFAQYPPTNEMIELVDDISYNGLTIERLGILAYAPILYVRFDKVVPQGLIDRWKFIFEENTHPLYTLFDYIVIANNITNDVINVR